MIALAKSKTKRDFPGRIMEAFDLYSPEIDADPFPYYEILREQYPCYWSESGKLWILSRYDDIVEATRDWETFSSSQGNMIDELPGRAGATLGTTDPPRHDRLRALSQAAFARRNVEQFITPTLEIADRALARICERKHFEFINDFSSQITVGVLFRTMGLPQRDHADIRRKVILAVSTDKSVKGRNPEHIAAFKELSDFLSAEVALRRAKATDDLITHLAEAEIDGDRLSEREVVLTTATFANPALIEPAIEESLRFNTSAQRFKRTVMRETELHGQRMHVGDKVALAFGSGNRDWRKFPNPDVYDIDRRPQGHLGFGAGKHFCLGSQMARLVTAIAMKRFLEHVPEYHLDVDAIAWNSSSNFRSPGALPYVTH